MGVPQRFIWCIESIGLLSTLREADLREIHYINERMKHRVQFHFHIRLEQVFLDNEIETNLSHAGLANSIVLRPFECGYYWSTQR